MTNIDICVQRKTSSERRVHFSKNKDIVQLSSDSDEPPSNDFHDAFGSKMRLTKQGIASVRMISTRTFNDFPPFRTRIGYDKTLLKSSKALVTELE